MTPHGIKACFPVLELEHNGLTIACLPRCSVDKRHVGLILTPCSDPDARTPLASIYDISASLSSTVNFRLLFFENYEELKGVLDCSHFNIDWREIYIRTRPQDQNSFEALSSKRLSLVETPPFCTLPERLLHEYDIRRVLFSGDPSHSASDRSNHDVTGPSDGDQTYIFYSVRAAAARVRDSFLVHLGRCIRGSGSSQLWAKTTSMPRTPQSEWQEVGHECLKDHAEKCSSGYKKTCTITFPGTPTTSESSTTKQVDLTFTRPSGQASSTTSANVDETRPWDLDVQISIPVQGMCDS